MNNEVQDIFFDESGDALIATMRGVFKYNGTLDKIVGDELMVLYGVPLKNEMDTENAVNTAVEMFKKLDNFNKEITGKNFK